jgi:hypothetical protein
MYQPFSDYEFTQGRFQDFLDDDDCQPQPDIIPLGRTKPGRLSRIMHIFQRMMKLETPSSEAVLSSESIHRSVNE